MTRITYVLAALAVILLTAVSPAAASADPNADHTGGNGSQCVPIRPDSDFYEAGRVASEELTTRTSRCTTISVSNVRDANNPADRCQSFLLLVRSPVDGSLTATEPVTACGRHRTVLARDVPDNTDYRVLYEIDYLDQSVKFRVWH
jgi:hypothetical protein